MQPKLLLAWLGGVMAAIIGLAPAGAAPVKGQVVDAVTGVPIPDVNVVAVGTERGAATDLAGRFNLEVGAASGTVVLELTHLNYQDVKVEAAVGGEMVRVAMQPAAVRGSEAVVTLGRSDRGAGGGAVTSLDPKLVRLVNGVQEPPQVAAETPNATYFGWGGLPIGPTHLRIRGFDSNRLAVSVNGVPANDPEDHNVYWQDLPDIMSNAYTLEVQRGVSDLRAGPAGVGGGLNLTTADAVANRALQVSYLGGSYGTSRRTLLYRSGLVEGAYNFTGRFSRVKTDGYRDHSRADMWSYFISAVRYDRNMVTRLQTYGGEEVSDLAFDAVARAVLDTNRSYNPAAHYDLNYDGEQDNFRQPHYVLHHQWRLSDRVSLDQTCYWVTGDGYYEQYRARRKFAEYNLIPFTRVTDVDGDGDLDTITVDRTDLIRRKFVTKDQRGWAPRVHWKAAERTELEAVGEFRHYYADHWGRVVWARELPQGVSPAHEWYRWSGAKDYFGVTVNAVHQMSGSVLAQAGLQLRTVNYAVNQRRLGAFAGYEYEVDYQFINPRLGVVWTPNESTRLYATAAGAGREPIDEQILNADNPADKPKLPRFGLAEVNPERMWDLEVGGERNWSRLSLRLNAYAMFFTDEIVPTGEWDANLDEAVLTNAPTSRHLGVELEGQWRTPGLPLRIKGNLALDRSELGDFTYHYFDETWTEHILNLKGNRIALTPAVTGNVRALWETPTWTASVHLHHVGKQFLDNREDDRAALDAYTTLNAATVVRLPVPGGVEVDAELRAYNLLDAEYETFGWVEEGSGRFIPAAGRSWLAGVTLHL